MPFENFSGGMDMEVKTIENLQRMVDEVFNREPVAVGKTIKHFIFVRFFTFEDPKYPHDIYDPNFLFKQLALANNILSSLENQTNKNFDLVFMVNSNFFENPKYEFIFSTLRNGTTLPIKFVKIPQEIKSSEGGSFLLYDKSEIPSLIKVALNEYDFVIQTRMDFDDFIFKDAVADTQSKVNECNRVLLYGYCKGYLYALGELRTHINLWSERGHNSPFQSVILDSSAAGEMPLININKFYHDIFKKMLKEFLEKNGIEFSENMFQQNTSTRAYIYYRHELSHWISCHNKWPLMVEDKDKLTTINVTKKYLEEEFGFTGYELNSIE